MQVSKFQSGEDIGGYLSRHEQKDVLRFIACGSVDDGKSTLIGRLLYDSNIVFEDQLDRLKSDSKKFGTQGDSVDLALLVDGLAAEREQGITIDVAYRFFSTDKRMYIVADCPGHEQYTRNMATGASTADLAVLLVDARHGIVTQTMRHAFIVSMLGIREIVLAVNKMDIVDFEEKVVDEIAADFSEFVQKLDGQFNVQTIPMSALLGANVTKLSERMPWYGGPTLVEHLETVTVEDKRIAGPFRMPVQWVNRPNSEFRGFSGQIVSGSVKSGDRVKVLSSGQDAGVERIATMDGDISGAVTGQSVTLVLDKEVDVSRGDVIASHNSPAEVSDQFQVRLLWASTSEMLPGRRYLLKSGSRTVAATVYSPKHKIDVNTLQAVPTKTLGLNEIGILTLSLDQGIAFDPYDSIRDTGSFILIDRLSNDTVGLGMIEFALRRASNIHWQALDVDRTALASQKNQKPCVLWFTGLSGSGKSTIANALQKRLYAMGKHTFVLDGDNVRHGLNRDLGFTDADRVENIRRVANVAKLMSDAGLIVIVSFISPFRSERRMARSTMGKEEYVEIHVNTPLHVAEARDTKGLYKKARAGEIANFTGIDSPYEPPKNPEIVIDTTVQSAEDATESIIEWLESRQYLA